MKTLRILHNRNITRTEAALLMPVDDIPSIKYKSITNEINITTPSITCNRIEKKAHLKNYTGLQFIQSYVSDMWRLDIPMMGFIHYLLIPIIILLYYPIISKLYYTGR